MPHDKNGKLVEVGDIVMGSGYEHTIIGPVLSVTPGCSSCDLQVGVLEVLPPTTQAFGRIINAGERTFVLLPSVETHTAADFEILRKADGSDAV